MRTSSELEVVHRLEHEAAASSLFFSANAVPYFIVSLLC